MVEASGDRRSVEERRQQLVEAASEVIANDGLSRATTRRITDHAGLALGAFHYSFDSKDDLLEAVIEDFSTEIESALREAVANPDEGVERALHDIVEAAWSVVDKQPRAQLARQELTVHALRDRSLRDAAVRQYERFTRAVMEALQEVPGALDGEALEDVARFVVATVDGLALQRFVHPDLEAAHRRVEMYLRCLAIEPLTREAA